MDANNFTGVKMNAKDQEILAGGKNMESNYNEPFINRIEELKIVKEVLKNAKAPHLRIKKPILEFWGIGGIGKSFLLMEIIRQFQEFSTSYTFIDLDEYKNNKPIELIVNTGKQLPVFEEQKQLINKLKDAINSYSQHKINFDAVQDLFISLLREILKLQPLFFIFDAMETVLQNRPLLEWLLNTWEQLVDHGKFGIMFTSRRLINFTESIIVNRKLYDYQLRPFSIKETKSQLESIKNFDHLKISPEIFDQVYDISAGHPLFNKFLIDIAESKSIQQNDFQKHLPELFDTLDDVIDKWLLHDVKNDKKIGYKSILTTLSVPRQFNLRIMEKLMQIYNPELALPSSLAYIDLVNELRNKTSLIDWDFLKSAYSVDLTIRKILKHRIQYNSPENFININKTMTEIYRQWIEQLSGFDRVKYLLELIYHQVYISESKESVTLLFSEYIERFFSTPEQYDERNQLKEHLQGDNELNELIGNENFKKMLKMIML